MGNKDDTDAAFRFHIPQQVLYGFSYIHHFIFSLCGDGDRFHLFFSQFLFLPIKRALQQTYEGNCAKPECG